MNIVKHFPQGWNKIKTNWLVGMTHKFVLLLFALSVIILAWRWTSLPPKVPLWFSRPWGESQLASPLWLILLPLTSLLWYGADLCISVYLTSEYFIFTQMLFLSSLIVSFLSFFALIKILFLVS